MFIYYFTYVLRFTRAERSEYILWYALVVVSVELCALATWPRYFSSLKRRE